MSGVPEHLLVFGATGPTGLEIVQQALERGMKVTAFVRDPGKLNVTHPNLRTVTGEIGDPDSIETAMALQPDAVVSALGIFHKQPDTRLSEGTTHIVAAMKSHELERIVIVSSLGAGDSRGQGNLIAKGVQKFILRHVLDDKTRQEQVLRESGLDWTSFRPPQLTMDAKRRDDIVLWSGEAPQQNMTWKVSRATVAKYVLDAVQNHEHSCLAVNMSEAR